MAEELQHLIERIQREAVDTGEQQAAQLVAQAKEKSAGLVREAEAQAKALIQKAEQDAVQFTERSTKTLQQASRDVLISVGQGVESIFAKLALESAQQALTPDTVREMLIKMAGAYAASAGGKAEILLNPQDQQALLSFFQQQFREQLQKGLTVRGDERVIKGFQISLDGGRIKHQFTPESIAEALANFLRPQLSEIVYQVARGSGGKPA